MTRFFLAMLPVLAGFVWAGEFWTEKKPADWTAEEKTRLLTLSPWAKTVSVGLNQSREMDQRRRSGMIYGPQGERAPNAIPKMQAVVRWETAEPVRAAGKPLPEEAKDHLVISVSMTGALSAPEDRPAAADEELLRATSLQSKGRMAVNPILSLRDDHAGVIYFLFPAKDAVRAGDKEWEFETTLGMLRLKAKFTAREMVLLGRPAL
ncbi:MAG TPA: hypothetical protein VFQ91_05190 [Bryobacteraceae bacterium]|nr:hypothetical protein [Bryobacteraceae bacterium]